MMRVLIVKDELEGGRVAFDQIKGAIATGSLHVLGLATGSTPLSLYKEIRNSDLDFSNIISVNLDEYVGLGEEDAQSYRYFMKENLFNDKPFKESYVPNGLIGEEACDEYNQILEEHPIDLQILGLGRNGHIGFNEPGTSFESETHKVQLTASTIEANKRFFERAEDVPTEAYSMGIASIMKAKSIILMSYGESKADAVQKMIQGEVTEEVPASILQNHKDVTIIIDEAAASKLKK